MSASVRLPVDPLVRAAGAHLSIASQDHPAGCTVLQLPNPVGALALQLGTRPRTVHRWKAEGGIPFYVADRAALALGMHPGEVWGQAWWAASYEQDILETARVDEVADRRAARWLAARPVLVRERRALVRQYEQCERAQARMNARGAQ